MQVNKENYESLLIDYLDGTLDPARVGDLLAFINGDPVLKAELEVLLTRLEISEEEPNSEKTDFSFLKKPTPVNLNDEMQELMIGSIESDLSTEQQNTLNRNLVLYPELKPEFELFQKTKLQPDHNIVFENKQLLKRKPQAVIIPMYRKMMAAAAVILFIGFATLMYYNLQNQTSDVANNKQVAQSMPENERVEPNEIEVLNPSEKKSIQKSSSVQKVNVKHRVSGNRGINIEHKAERVNIAATEINTKQMQLLKVAGMNENLIVLPTYKYRHPVQMAEIAVNDQFLKPRDWLFEKLKETMPETNAMADTLINGGIKGAGVVALNLLNKTTGIIYTPRKTDSGTQGGFSIISRFFAFERITQNEE
ncbi:MAG: hypothetical protein Q8M15_13155 [Bacteroidota bacterium]|nr:hypothetical protein [Bacteroidota bacterium]